MERDTPARTGQRRRRERGSFPTPAPLLHFPQPPVPAAFGLPALQLQLASRNSGLPRARPTPPTASLSGPFCNPVRWPAVCVSAHWRLESLLAASVCLLWPLLCWLVGVRQMAFTNNRKENVCVVLLIRPCVMCGSGRAASTLYYSACRSLKVVKLKTIVYF